MRGLPVPMRAVEAGYLVPARCQCGPPHQDTSECLTEDISDNELRNVLESGHYRPTRDYKETDSFDLSAIAAPTSLKEKPTGHNVHKFAAQSITPYVRAGSLVILELTTYPGPTEELNIPILGEGSELDRRHGLPCEYSPERVDPSNPEWSFKNTPKVISRLTQGRLVSRQGRVSRPWG
ncbi:hypothetical protein [Saxibacter everestensis]|uniref:hypothetical protein n=1 Tax=Saxibacter everestensis TaxID=2909229 RepID=UPI003D80A6F5